MKIKKKSGSGGANWMDTYGDMVTLLLCFFVMLYSMSSVDQNRWLALVQSFNPDAVIAETATGGNGEEEGVTLSRAQVEQEMEELYQNIVEYVQGEGMGSQVTVTKGSGYVFITFDDTVFFGPDSAVLLDSGKSVLDGIIQSLRPYSQSIGEIRVLGHTAQGDPQTPNNPVVDRTLSSSRANNVAIYLQEQDVIDPAKLVSIGYGQWRPIASNDTSEGRAKNRRVELIVTGLDSNVMAGDSVEEYRPEQDHAPVVLAKGQDLVALRIVQIAKQHQVAVVENVPLARALYATAELNREIPPDLYNAVAEVLVYLYRMDHKAMENETQ